MEFELTIPVFKRAKTVHASDRAATLIGKIIHTTFNLLLCHKHAYRILVGKSEGKRPLGRPRRRWVNNIKIDFREIEWDGVDWIDLAQDRDQWRALVNTVMKFWVP
jgi:hypothetical protein